MKQLVFKPYKGQTDEPKQSNNNPDTTPKAKAKAKTNLKTLSDSTAPMVKLTVTWQMVYQHPTSSLIVGTLSANIKHALLNKSDLQQEVVKCI